MQVPVIAHPDGGNHVLYREIIEQDDINADDVEQLLELVEIVYFNLGKRWFGWQGFDVIEHLEDVVGETIDGNAHEVVVLDEDGIVKSEAVVLSASAADGVFFEEAPTGDCFAGVVDFGLGVGDGVDELAGEGGDAR